MRLDDAGLEWGNAEIPDGVLHGKFGMTNTVQAGVCVVPVIKVIIMEESSTDQCLFVNVCMKALGKA